ncbi:hypothetical protein I5M27_15370 [Adhaeribacter sp. BT258]|uniref:Uncharacterized protein n=1 Tax=Adhaeribacter terrigena TaxID=2793070 RepID=A0ABS1C5B7_9BACT|nr:hypothetical protein [Adhaeribacter terrigena]MBK0404377.1 hypothetical protein [Adhaeribacter terrigena]
MRKFAILKITLIFLMLAKPAMAYINPGSGSMILQVILAGILGGLFAIKVFWLKIAAFFKSLTGSKKNHPPTNEQ